MRNQSLRQSVGRWFARYYHRGAPAHAAWVDEYARTTSVIWAGSTATLRDVRNFRYRSRTEYMPAYYDTRIDLEQLNGVDLVISRWSGNAIAHVFLSFSFDDHRPIAISVETRRREGQKYSTFGGFFRNYSLVYVVADERDLIGVRTDIRRERVSLYRLKVPPETARALLSHYLDRVASLNHTPEYYHTVCNNCTTNVLHHAHAVHTAVRYDWKVLVSGYADRYAYDLGLLDTTQPFDVVAARAIIRREPGAQPGDDYSDAIRQAPLST